MDYKTTYKFGSDVSYVFKNRLHPLLKDLVVLDLGCGQGDYLAHFGQGSLGLDISPKNLASCKEKGLSVQEADFNNPPELKTQFDAVFASHIIEHVENPVAFLRFSHRMLKPGGKLVLSVPNEYSFIHMVYPYFTNDGNHLYSFTKNNMKELLAVTGFDLKELFHDYFTAKTGQLGLNPSLGILDLLGQSLSTPFAWAFWFIAEKK